MQFNLRGQGNFCQLEIDPPVLFFEEDLYINNVYKKTLILKKKSDGNIKLWVRLEGKSDEGLNIEI
jgi:hypothetical protein